VYLLSTTLPWLGLTGLMTMWEGRGRLRMLIPLPRRGRAGAGEPFIETEREPFMGYFSQCGAELSFS
jgi:hypothetical protein